MERLIVDGYNIIFAWPELAALKDASLQDARELLIATLADYAAMTRQKVTVVFDSHRRPDAEASEHNVSGVQVVWLIDPRKRTIRVYSAPDESILLRVGQTINGGDVLPGLSLPVARVFAGLPPTRKRKGGRSRSRRINGTK